MKVNLSIILILFSFSIFALEEEQITKIIEKHSIAGHMTNEEVDDQKFNLINSKNYQLQFKTQVRGVASKFSENQKVLELKNPVIEISVD